MQAWIAFFIALHDYGKLDVRFQCKAPMAMAQAWPGFDHELIDIKGVEIKRYYHGPAGYSWFYQDFQTIIGWNEYDDERWEQWGPWLAAVMGHHGVIPLATDHAHLLTTEQADAAILDHDRTARISWVSDLEALFLKPAGLSVQDDLAECPPLLPGLCSICDWIGSRDEADEFFYRSSPSNRLIDYFESSLPIAERLIVESGLLSGKKVYQGVQPLLPNQNECRPRQLQVLVDRLPVEPGLSIIEAPTGSGKTEAALAYAWRLLDSGLADSIIFALPTQATANAMLGRLEKLAGMLFQDHPNLVLAHGKAGFNETFWRIKGSAEKESAQGEEEATVQCAAWLSASRKRAFLGQIGVCTVDQVLVSVLPVKHKFVRGFGIGKSVLLVDEVHAYDQYMYRLLMSVLEMQKAAGGSAILLSATLPVAYRALLFSAWGGTAEYSEAYPLTSWCGGSGEIRPFNLPAHEMPEERLVGVEMLEAPSLYPDERLIERIIEGARQGAQVALICNLVDAAQHIYRTLKERTAVPVDLFHARYRFCDRQDKEKQVLECYGKEGSRCQGRILVATQVIEQSLDLDFDWMVTQLCPVDLLFQRLGRLHRHPRARPSGFDNPCCTVLVPDSDDYGLHELIYGDARLLWRTAEQLWSAGGQIAFPAAYRDWIEAVYCEAPWPQEPATMTDRHLRFAQQSEGAYFSALQLVNGHPEPFDDSDNRVAILTRDGEMSLNVLPVTETARGLALLDGVATPLSSLTEWQRDETINLNTVSVPNSWRTFLPEAENGLVVLPMSFIDGCWTAQRPDVSVHYSQETGMEKVDR